MEATTWIGGRGGGGAEVGQGGQRVTLAPYSPEPVIFQRVIRCSWVIFAIYLRSALAFVRVSFTSINYTVLTSANKHETVVKTYYISRAFILRFIDEKKNK